MDQPVLKKDMYAFLMFFYLDQSREPLTVQYSDMDVNDNYLSLYQHFSAILPEPVLNRFYPDSFVTVKDMIKLLLALENNYQSISDGNILSDFLDIPPQFKSIIPKNWDRQVQFSSRREVIHLFMNYFDYSLDRYEKQMTISWPRVSTEKTETYSKIQYKFENFIRFFKVPSFLRQPFQLFSSYEKTAKVNTKSKINSKKVQDKSSYQSIEVLPGDSIPKISKRYFGTTKYWKDIIQLNNLEIKQVTINEKVVSSVSIFPGQKLYLPNN